jgi:hypothetical protein
MNCYDLVKFKSKKPLGQSLERISMSLPLLLAPHYCWVEEGWGEVKQISTKKTSLLNKLCMLLYHIPKALGNYDFSNLFHSSLTKTLFFSERRE